MTNLQNFKMWGIVGACVAGEVIEWFHGELCMKESETSE